MIILDSNIWIAGYNEKDTLHEKALELYFSLDKETILIPEYVWIEVSTVLEQKAAMNVGKKFLDIMEFSDNMELLYFSENEAREFMEFYRSEAPEGLSFIDAVLLLLSKKYTVYTFDKKLEKAIAGLL